MLQSLQQSVSGEPAGRVQEVVERLDQSIAEIRRSIYSLHAEPSHGASYGHGSGG